MSAKKSIYLFLLYGCIAFISFHQYGVGRTFVEAVGLTAKGFTAGLLFGFGVPLLILLPLIALLKYLYTWDWRKTKRLLAVSCVFLCAGCVIAEIYVSHDESQFLQLTTDTHTLISRDRAWPNQSSSLVYIPNQGAHATD